MPRGGQITGIAKATTLSMWLSYLIDTLLIAYGRQLKWLKRKHSSKLASKIRLDRAASNQRLIELSYQ